MVLDNARTECRRAHSTISRRVDVFLNPVYARRVVTLLLLLPAAFPAAIHGQNGQLYLRLRGPITRVGSDGPSDQQVDSTLQYLHTI